MPRHEQQTVRMALAAALHHSAGPKEKKVVLQQHAALRGPNTGARARDGEVHEKYDAPRRQNAPHPGERPGSFSDLGPQRSDRSLRRSAGDCLPTLALPVLAGSAGEAVDARTLRFLLGRSLAEKEEEEQRKAQVEELRQASLARARELHGSKRKRKKRRKRRTLALFVAVVDSGSGMRAVLVSLVTFLFALCSLRFLAGS